MSNKEMSEIDETQEKTEDKIKTSEEAANNLEDEGVYKKGSETNLLPDKPDHKPYKGNETVSPPNGSTESQHGDSGSKKGDQHQAKDDFRSFEDEVKKFAKKNVPLGSIGINLKLNGIVGRPEEGHYTYRPYSGSNIPKMDIIEFENELVEGKVSPEHIQSSNSLESAKPFEKGQPNQTDASEKALNQESQPPALDRATELQHGDAGSKEGTQQNHQVGDSYEKFKYADEIKKTAKTCVPEGWVSPSLKLNGLVGHIKEGHYTYEPYYNSHIPKMDIIDFEDELVKPCVDYQKFVEDLTDKYISEKEREIFGLIEKANIATESGGKATWSRLDTVPGEKASFGRGQLTIEAHITELLKLKDSQLKELDLDRSALNDIAKHGQAAKNWFEVIVYDSKKAAKDLGLTHEELKSLKELMQKGKYDQILKEYGERFSQSTGLSKKELRNYLYGRELSNFISKNQNKFKKTLREIKNKYQKEIKELRQKIKEIRNEIKIKIKEINKKIKEKRDELKQKTKEIHNEIKNEIKQLKQERTKIRNQRVNSIKEINKNIKRLRQLSQPKRLRETAVERMKQTDEKFKRICDNLKDRLDPKDIGYYFSNPKRFGENRAAAFTQGAKTSKYWDEFEKALQNGLSDVTDRMRSIKNYKQAKFAVSKIPEFKKLPSIEQAKILGKLARVFHLSPKIFKETFFEKEKDNTYIPKYTTLEKLQEAIKNLPRSPKIAVENWEKNFDKLIENQLDVGN